MYYIKNLYIGVSLGALLNLFWIFEYLTWGLFAGLLSDVFPNVEKLASFCSGGYFEF